MVYSKISRLLILASLLLAIPQAHSLEVSSATNHTPMTKNLRYICLSEVATPQQVMAMELIPLNKENLQLGVTQDSCWFLTEITNTEKQHNKFIIDFGFSLLHNVTVYYDLENYDQQKTPQIIKTGFMVRDSDKQMATPFATVQIEMDAFETKKLLIKINTETYMYAEPSISSIENYLAANIYRLVLIGLFYGACFGVFAHSIVIYVSIRDISYFYYLVYIICVVFIMASLDGYTAPLWADAPHFKVTAMNCASGIALLAAALFARSHLGLVDFPRIMFFNNLVVWSSAGLVLIAIFMSPIVFSVVSSIVTPFAVVPYVFAGFLRVRQGDVFARFYLAGWCMPLVFATALAFAGFGSWISMSTAMAWLKVGYLCQIIAFSAGIIYRINMALRERDLSERKALEVQLAAQAKNDFFAQMSHEIRTPLNGVLGILQLIDVSKLDDTSKNYIKSARNSGATLLTIINDILDFSKIEAGRLEIAIIDIDLHEMVEDIINSFKINAHAKGLEAHCDISAAPRYIQSDPTRIKQIINNLLNNALKFTQRGAINLVVSTTSTATSIEEEMATIYFEINDSGIGITQDTQEKLFHEYTQADLNTTRQFGGTGLGLAICKKLAALMGGNIGVTSEIGVGSHFWFTIQAQVINNMAPEIADQQDTITHLGNLRILVADDNHINRMVMEGLLKKWTVHIDKAENGAEAVDCYIKQKGCYSVIMMDWDMPVLDGASATRKIREYEKLWGLAATPIVACTGHVSDDMRRKSEEAGMNLYLTKPVSRDDLASMMNELFLKAS